MPNPIPLNPDALHQLFAVAMMEVLDAEKLQPGDRLAHVNDIQEVLNRLEKNVLAVAQPEVNSVEELDALPIGSVLIELSGKRRTAVKTRVNGVLFAEELPEFMTYQVSLPARVLYRPAVNDA